MNWFQSLKRGLLPGLWPVKNPSSDLGFAVTKEPITERFGRGGSIRPRKPWPLASVRDRREALKTPPLLLETKISYADPRTEEVLSS